MASTGVPPPSYFEYSNVVLHHVPNAVAPGVLANMLVYSGCLGAILMELLTNLLHDWTRVVCRPGWREPRKALNRASYFICRYGAFACLLISCLFMNLAGNECARFGRAINLTWQIPLVFVDVIFIQRTLAVWNWDRSLTVILTTLYTIYLPLSFYSVTEFGYGYDIPGSRFCAYKVRPIDMEPRAAIYIAYLSMIITIDTLILLLTTHKVTKGGLCNVLNLTVTNPTYPHDDDECDHESGEVCLTGLLLRQGIAYYIVVEGSRLAFLIVYYTQDNQQSYQIIVLGLMGTLCPIMAGFLFRQTAEAVQRATVVSSQRSEQPLHPNGIERVRSTSVSTALMPAEMGSIVKPAMITATDHRHYGNAGRATNSSYFSYGQCEQRRDRSIHHLCRSHSCSTQGGSSDHRHRIDQRFPTDVEQSNRYQNPSR